MGHWCEFCQMEHSSLSCFHPGRRLLAEAERERDEAIQLGKTDRKMTLDLLAENRLLRERLLLAAGTFHALSNDKDVMFSIQFQCNGMATFCEEDVVPLTAAEVARVKKLERCLSEAEAILRLNGEGFIEAAHRYSAALAALEVKDE